MAYKLPHEVSVQGLAWAAGLPGVAFAGWAIATGDYTPKAAWALGLAIGGAWLGLGLLVRRRVAAPLRTVSRLLGRRGRMRWPR